MSTPNSKPHIVLGVCGSVAAYRAADLARDLMRSGAEVRVCLTDAAEQFVTKRLFEALTGNPVLTSVFDEPDPGQMAHIQWARWATTVVVAPATANTIAKIAAGIADDMLTTIVSATAAPLVVAPAMNPQMYASEANRLAMSSLRKRGAEIVEAEEGDVACGEHGEGKLASTSRIVSAVLELRDLQALYAGKKVVITSGPTQEPIDAVRFLSNRSSGRMGAALAKAALMMGASVTVVSGPVALPYPLRASVRRVRTAEEMLREAMEAAEGADLIVGAAAVADFRPAKSSDTKIRKTEQPLVLQLTPNVDIIAALAERFPNARVVGFAAEPAAGLEEVQAKLKRKGLFAIAGNDISNPSIGFESEQNELKLMFANGESRDSGRLSKLACAIWLLTHLAGSPG